MKWKRTSLFFKTAHAIFFIETLQAFFFLQHRFPHIHWKGMGGFPPLNFFHSFSVSFLPVQLGTVFLLPSLGNNLPRQAAEMCSWGNTSLTVSIPTKHSIIILISTLVPLLTMNLTDNLCSHVDSQFLLISSARKNLLTNCMH